MAARAMFLQATWNYERQQGVGFAWALKPALDRLVPDEAERARRLALHTAYFNTQPSFASMALGAVAAIEERRAAGEPVDDAATARIKHALGSSLAALGDRLFWFTLRPFAATLGVLVALVVGPWGAAVMWVCYNTVHLGVRTLGVGWGYRGGPAAFDAGLRGRFEALARSLATLGAGLVGVLTAWLLAPGGLPQPMVAQAALAAGLGLGFFTAQRARPSPTEWALGVGALCLAVTWFRT